MHMHIQKVSFTYDIFNYDLLVAPRHLVMSLRNVRTIGIQAHRLMNTLSESFQLISAFYVSYEGNVYALQGMTEEDWDKLVRGALDESGDSPSGIPTPDDLEIRVAPADAEPDTYVIKEGDATVHLPHLKGWRIRLFRNSQKSPTSPNDTDFHHQWDAIAGDLFLTPAAAEKELIQIEPY